MAEIKIENEQLRDELVNLRKKLDIVELDSLVSLEDELVIIKNENDQLKSDLQSKNNSATTETDNTEINKEQFFDEELTLLQSENEQLRDQLSILRKQLSIQSINATGDDPSMLEKAMDLEMKLEIALAKSNKWKASQIYLMI